MSDGNTPNFVTHYADAINRGEPIRLPGGGLPRRDLLYVDDLSSACQSFVDSGLKHGLYNLGGGRQLSLTLSELVKKLEEVSGLQAIVDNEVSLPDPVPLNYVTDIGLVRRELDWDPKVDLDEGLARLFRPQ